MLGPHVRQTVVLRRRPENLTQPVEKVAPQRLVEDRRYDGIGLDVDEKRGRRSDAHRPGPLTGERAEGFGRACGDDEVHLEVAPPVGHGG
ncbi:hypothetical protein ACWDG9_23500 [Streptomyces sp. NPDC001073]